MKQIVNTVAKLNWGKTYAAFALCAMTAIALPAQTFTTLHAFEGKDDGAVPVAGLVQATNGDFYGTTIYGGANNDGTVFKITPSGTLTMLYSFCAQSGCPDGWQPSAGLVQAASGEFYGTTSNGGVNGTVFKISPSGTLTTLYTFCTQIMCTDGSYPWAGLVQATNGDFYGTTTQGGLFTNYYCSTLGCGTIFKIDPSGTLTTLYSFCSQSGCTDGSGPSPGSFRRPTGTSTGQRFLVGPTQGPSAMAMARSSKSRRVAS